MQLLNPGNRGQMTLILLMNMIIVLVGFFALWPTLDASIQAGIEGSDNAAVNFIAPLIPFFMLLAFIIAFNYWAMPRAPAYGGG